MFLAVERAGFGAHLHERAVAAVLRDDLLPVGAFPERPRQRQQPECFVERDRLERHRLEQRRRARLRGRALRKHATATDVVLTITEMLRRHGVVGKFVEFYGEGAGAVPLANRATIGNMSPEFGSTAAIFPIDEETMRYLRLTGRADAHIALIEAYAKEQGLWHDPSREPVYSETLELDLGTVVPSIAGPKRPQDRIALTDAKPAFRKAIRDYTDDPASDGPDSMGSTRRARSPSPPATPPHPDRATTTTPSCSPRPTAARGVPRSPPPSTRPTAASSCSTTAPS